ncbi:bifunctional UDP-N-acetylglucosamine diphosphorylase/glucosamine-1-phosphate N-acetyltransferase GlmU [Natranaerofaba carboxydovora]|uniref:bifunctional UDP-N-acetylglucosamine diphosphorylase/glucosamine-1-phosphate N-acetyltransferase GlmU n=1 Tax=Natranaerofaba carboxydovora TaxID=2742683 RepID=UPI002402ADFF|nr:bifunctional UDP-N-acetylglucosamine diphosphorylase/glucosamine-1-phosphate N-acetyltransferase GlmU [Natranaerofaba carboxydovora]UMZ75269.1 Bifunctional protein GlmU [Natranaerofaba carboxydovora]
MTKDCAAIILAAGKGTRMKSNTPKVLHSLCNKPMLWHVIKSINPLSREQVVVVGHQAEKVKEFLNKKFDETKVMTALQEEQLGTGHAVLKAKEAISDVVKDVLIVMGDTPLLLTEELKNLLNFHRDSMNACTVLTAKLDNPSGYGRIVRNSNGEINEIIEDKEASKEIKEVKEINTGIYCFRKDMLFSMLEKLSPSEVTGEYYLTDLIKLLNSEKEKVGAKELNDFSSVLGINDRKDLVEAQKILQKRINEFHMENGVTVIEPENTMIDPEVSIDSDTIVYPGTYLENGTVVGANCILGPDTKISDSYLKDNVKVIRSSVNESVLESYVQVGPYAQIRPYSKLMDEVKIGDFVEVKNSLIGEKSKASHLSYIGDATIGKEVNIGAGTVVVNYDGKNKYETIIKDGAFIGCNSSLIAPVKINEGAFVAAGSTITDDVEQESLAIARQRQVNKKGWRKQK